MQLMNDLKIHKLLEQDELRQKRLIRLNQTQVEYNRRLEQSIVEKTPDENENDYRHNPNRESRFEPEDMVSVKTQKVNESQKSIKG